MDNVSWNDCQRFLAQVRRTTGRVVRLPTEAQWEFACRAGTTTRWYFGENEKAVRSHAWSGENAGGMTHPVGVLSANPWGLHDLYGNVWEWCEDWYTAHYSAGDARDPAGPPAGDARVLRGGAWGDAPDQTRSAYRNSMGPDNHNAGTGLRCVLSIETTALSP